MVWVADRGFASAANRAYLTRGGGHYIHAEKLRNTNSEAAAALARAGRYRTVAGNLRVKEVHVAPGGHGDGDQGARAQRFVVCHNPDQADRDAAVRDRLVDHLQGRSTGPTPGAPAPRRVRRLPEGQARAAPLPAPHRSGLLRIDHATVNAETHLDGKWLLRTSDVTLSAEDLAAAYKQLLPSNAAGATSRAPSGCARCSTTARTASAAHVQLCWLALLLVRVVENATGDTWRNTRHELDRMHLVTLATTDGQVAQRTATTAGQKTILCRPPATRAATVHRLHRHHRLSRLTRRHQPGAPPRAGL